MRTVWTKGLIGTLTAAALAASALASPADARSLFMRGGHGGHSGGSHALIGGGDHGGFHRGGGFFAGGPSNRSDYTNAYNGGYYGGYGPAFGLGAFGLAVGTMLGAATASADEGCLVRQPIWSHGRIVGHRWVDVC